MFKLYEPFFLGLPSPSLFVDYFGGTGVTSVWFRRLYPKCRVHLNEMNPDIFGLYSVIQKDYSLFCSYIKDYVNPYLAFSGRFPQKKGLSYEENKKTELFAARKEYYYRLRHLYTDIMKNEQTTQRYALLFFLLQTCMNGYWQTRAADGVWNTPFGKGDEKGEIVRWNILEEFHQVLTTRTEISNKDYIDIIEPGEIPNSIHYFDPPYVNSTIEASAGFTIRDTKALCDRILFLAYRGRTVFFSNKSDPLLLERLKFLSIENFFDIKYTASVNMNTKGSMSDEILAHNNKSVPLPSKLYPDFY